jgi:lipoyl synthase
MVGKRRNIIKQQPQNGCSRENTKKIIDDLNVQVLCESIKCPNRCQCITQGLATFLIMGDICTRDCNLCFVKHGKPLPLDVDEPENVAQAVKQLDLNYVVLSSVTRDDLPDGGAAHIARAVTFVHEINPDTSVEVMIHHTPLNDDALNILIDSAPEVITHEIKTVERLQPMLLDNIDYKYSLGLLEKIKTLNPNIVTKSGLMVGLGENDVEVVQLMEDLHDTGCNCITFGQYLPPSTRHYQLSRYITPQEFSEYQDLSLQMGYSSVRSGPFVRSSFDALEMYKEIAE